MPDPNTYGYQNNPYTGDPLMQNTNNLAGNLGYRIGRWWQNVTGKQYARDQDLQLLKYQNWYNSPVQQMNRLQEAGLNPHLVYGSGGPGAASTGQMKELPKYQASEFNPLMAVQIASMGADILVKKATAKKIMNEAAMGGVNLDILRNTKNEAIQTIKSQMQAASADAAIKYFTAAVDFFWKGGKGYLNIHELPTLFAGDVKNSLEWSKRVAELDKTYAEGSKAKEQAIYTMIEREFNQKMRDLGANNETIAILNSLLRMFKPVDLQ